MSHAVVCSSRTHCCCSLAHTVPVGHTVMLHSGKGEHQADPARQIAVYLGSDAPIWGNDFDRITLYAADGQVVDAREHRVKK